MDLASACSWRCELRFFPGVTAERKMKQQRLGGVEKEKHKVEIRARVGKVPSRRGLLVIGNYHASLRASLAAPSQFAERWPRGVVVDVDADRVRKPPKARAKAGAKRGAGLFAIAFERCSTAVRCSAV